jgi:hypothetical protein
MPATTNTTATSVAWAGFAHPGRRARLRRRRVSAFMHLIATAALTVSIAIAVVAVSIGAARAEPLGAIGNSAGGRVAVALLFGLLFAGIGIVVAALTRRRDRIEGVRWSIGSPIDHSLES